MTVPPIESVASAGVDLPPLVSLGTTQSGHDIRALRLPAGELVPWWHRLRGVHESTGYWPVLLGADPGDMYEGLPGGGMSGYDDAAQLARAANLNPQTLRDLRDPTEDDDFYAERDERRRDPAPDSLAAHAAVVTIAETAGLLALVPAAHGWEVPAILGWDGGCNYGLEPLDHVVYLRDWHARYGVELVGMSSDQVLEVVVARPPTTPAEALAVAAEHYDYCPDIVDQGVGTLTRLAADQVGSASWYFWWD